MAETMNLARLKKGSEIFEIVINPDQAIALRKNPGMDVREALVYPKIFSDAKKGMLASEQRMKALFGTSEPLEVAKIIIRDGSIQLTQEYRRSLLEQKKRRIIDLIHKQGVDPRTNAPHPLQRIERALEEAKVRIDEFVPAENQVQAVLKQLRPIIPIKLVTKEIELRIPAQHAPKTYPAIKLFGTIKHEEWLGDGSWKGVVEIPGGLEQELYDKLNAMTHGSVEAKVVAVKGEKE